LSQQEFAHPPQGATLKHLSKQIKAPGKSGLFQQCRDTH
jgi:hypothetical protein